MKSTKKGTLRATSKPCSDLMSPRKSSKQLRKVLPGVVKSLEMLEKRVKAKAEKPQKTTKT